jgi:uncharacterized membrane protein YcaP (DUF421 family)
MFQVTVSLAEIVLRVVVVYAGLFVLLRLTGKRGLSELAPMDLLTMLILSETVSPSLTRGDTSLTAGFTAAATLLAVTVLVDWATFRWPGFARVAEGRTHVLIEDGRVDRVVLRRHRISEEELASVLRREGLRDASEVERATVEVTGKITVVPRSPSR